MAEDRIAQVDRVLFDPPSVHLYEDAVLGQAPNGVWSTERDLYVFLGQHCDPGANTLETGLGISTVLFAAWARRHTCIVGDDREVDRYLAYCAARGIETGHVEFHVGWSDQVLPSLALGDLDLVLIDGGHGFPVPILDWYYAGARLRAGGIMVLDDAHLPSVSLGLVGFLDRDPRWRRIAQSWKWRAYQRETGGHLREEWWAQTFLGPRMTPRLRRVPAPLRPLASQLARRMRRSRGDRAGLSRSIR